MDGGCEEHETGEVVLALDNNLPRGRWPLGWIIERDGQTLVAKVQCGDKTFIRPIHKLCRCFKERERTKRLLKRSLETHSGLC